MIAPRHQDADHETTDYHDRNCDKADRDDQKYRGPFIHRSTPVEVL
jgi:hypothetical protein